MRKNLIKARKKAKYTQFELSNKLGITERHYRALETGTSKGSIDVWEKLKFILRAKSIDWLLEQSDDNSTQTVTQKQRASQATRCSGETGDETKGGEVYGQSK